MTLKKVVEKQLMYYQSMIKNAPDVETAIDMLDGVDLIFAAHVIDQKFGKGATAKALIA